MSELAVEWSSLKDLDDIQLRSVVFDLLRTAAAKLQEGEADDPATLELVPRLAELLSVKGELLKDFVGPFCSFARAAGLWNYIDKQYAAPQDALVAEAVTVSGLDDIVLHREQVAALNTLLAGRNLILSAPTSFGKSLLIDALLLSGKYSRIAIVLPTIALLDEFRRRIAKRFGQSFQIVMHPNEKAINERVVFLGTQERLIYRDDVKSLDLVVVDEFYKLDPDRQDERSVTLNAAVNKLLHVSKQFFFLGPNIDEVRVSSGSRWKFEFLKTRFSTVAVDTFDLSNVPNKEERLMAELANDVNWPALVFISSPSRANKLALAASAQMAVSDSSQDFADWLRHNVGANSSITKFVEFGFGVHHGRLPRAIAGQMVRLFNSNEIPVLFCTSTLIEGVNTAAKSVLVYDKKISRSNYDFFTFSNIKGRAGRLGQHHVGKVYLFNNAPEFELLDVAPTLFDDVENATDDYVVHLDEDPDFDAVERLERIKKQVGLSGEDLRLASSIGLENALDIRERVGVHLRQRADIAWTGSPTYDQILATLELICEVRSPSWFGVRSSKQLTLYIPHLRTSRTMREFLRWHDTDYWGDQNEHDNVFKFLRACEYGIPQFLSVVQVFLRQYSVGADYSYFIGEVSNWFRDENLKYLDEEGVPIQISERFFQKGDSRESLLERLGYAASVSGDHISDFERRWLQAVL